MGALRYTTGKKFGRVVFGVKPQFSLRGSDEGCYLEGDMDGKENAGWCCTERSCSPWPVAKHCLKSSFWFYRIKFLIRSMYINFTYRFCSYCSEIKCKSKVLRFFVLLFGRLLVNLLILRRSFISSLP